MPTPVPPTLRYLSDLFTFRCQGKSQELAYAFVRDSLDIESQLTYGELDRRVRSLTGHLARRVRPGARVLLLFPPGLDVVSAFWACICAGLVPVPAPALDPVRRKHSVPRLRAIVEDAQVSLVLTTSAIAPFSSELSIVKDGSQVEWVATDQLYDQTHEIDLPVLGEPSLAYLQYTSGSTATPRGVMISHQNVLAQCEALHLVAGVDLNSRSLCWLPYFHDYGLVHGIIAPFYAGIPAYLMSPVTFLRRPLRWLEAMDRWSITHSGAPNFAYESCTKALRQQKGWIGHLQHWVVASCGAEPIHVETIEEFAEAFHAHGFTRQAFTPAYGLAESTLVVTSKRRAEEPLLLHVAGEALAAHQVTRVSPDALGARTLVGCGPPLSGTTVRIVDPVTLAGCEADRIGEVWVASPSVAQGYWNRETAEDVTFRASLEGDRQRAFMRTGDLGFLHDGQLFVTGRLKDLIIVHGRNLYPGDIERTVERSHSGLRLHGGAAFSIQENREESVVVLQEVERAQSVDVDAIAMAIRQAVMDEHEVPVSSVVLVRSGGLPKTSSGKIQRGASKEAFITGTLPIVGISRYGIQVSDTLAAEGDLIVDKGGASGADLTSLEVYLQLMVAGHLSVDPSCITLTQPIGTVGIDSLKAGIMKNRLEEEFGTELSFQHLLIDWSIRDLAEHLLTHQHQVLPSAGARAVDMPALLPVTVTSPTFPLSSSQRRMWFAERLSPDSPLNNIPVAVRLRGPLNVPALEASVHAMVHRHDLLRVTIEEQSGVPFHRLSGDQAIAFRIYDYRGTGAERRGADLQRLLKQEAASRFDLRHGPLMRTSLLRVDEHEHVLIATFHHLIMDGWSIRLLCQELSVVYEAACSGEPVVWTNPAVSYRDYVAWEQTSLDRGRHDRQRRYWQKQLKNLPAPCELPRDFPRSGEVRQGSRTVTLAFSTAESDAFDRFCLQTGMTPFMATVAGLATLLYRYTGQTDLVVGAPVSNRVATQFEQVLGCMVNTVALRVDCSKNPTARALLAQVRRVVVDATNHQDLPFDEVVRAVSPGYDEARAPLFRLMVAWEEDAVAALRLAGVSAERVQIERLATPFDATVFSRRQQDHIQLAIEYNTFLFEEATITQMLDHLRSLLAEMAASLDLPLSELPLLTDRERQKVLVEWNRTRADDPSGSSIHALIDAQAAHAPDALAVVSESGTLTYRQLSERSNHVAQDLRRQGVQPGSLVGLLLERSLEMVVGMLGILKAGAAYVPLDPDYTEERLAFMVRDSQLTVVVTNSRLRSRLRAEQPTMVCLDADQSMVELSAEDGAPVQVAADALAYVIYTSGSTGRPKGAMISHRSLVNFALAFAVECRMSSHDCVLHMATISFDAAVLEIFPCLVTGSTLVLRENLPPGTPAEFMQSCAQGSVTMAFLPTAYWHHLVQEWAGDRVSIPASLRRIIIGGEKASEPVCVRWFALAGMRVQLLNAYGPTEATVAATMVNLSALWEDHSLGSEVPIGRPLRNMRVYVLDRHRNPVPVGAVGELYIAGLGVGLGYLHDPGLTADSFMADPFVPGDRMYKTGDLGRFRRDGQLLCLGRVDQQIKLRGFRIEPGEIEAALMAVPGVREATVVLREIPPRGPLIAAYVTTDAHAGLSGREILSGLRRVLPHYMVPAACVLLESLPYGPSGKVDRRALPMPALGSIDQAVARVAPRDHIEQSLMDMWVDVLGVPVSSVHDSFFDVSGHSLLATQVLSRIQELFSLNLPLRTIFDTPTIAQLAEHIRAEQRRGGGRAALPPIVAVSRTEPLPLSYSQQRMWVMYQLAPKGTAYNMPFASRQTGPLNKRWLRQTIQAVTRRHDSFRTTFRMTESGPVQVVADWQPPHWVEIDLQNLPRHERLAEAIRLVEEEARTPFDLERGPVARFFLITLDTEDHILVLSMHHIIGDQWSFGVIGQEFAAYYNALSQGHSVPDVSFPIQYVDFAMWQRRCLTDDTLRPQLEYWRDTLANLPVLSLPTDLPRPPMNTYTGSYCAWDLPSSLIERLKMFSAHRRVSSFMTLLACFQVLLSRWSGQTDFAVGAPIANRTQVMTESLVGTFVNTLVLRADLSEDPTFDELLRRVRDTALGAYENQDFPFEKLVDVLHVNRDSSHSPLIQVLFNVANAPIGEVDLHGLSWVPLHVDAGSAQFDMSLTVETEIAKKVYLSYSTDLFTRQTAERMLDHFGALLQQALAHPGLRVSELSMLSSVEEQRLLIEWNRTTSDYPHSQCFPDLFEAQVERGPDAIAVSMEGRALSYRVLNAQANQMARALSALGVTRDVTVGICLDRSIEKLVTLLAVWKAGGCYLPLDPDYPRDRVRFMLDDARATLVVTTTALSDRFGFQASRVLCLDRMRDSFTQEADHNMPPIAGVSDLAYILYTSGSTGQPKGVEITHRSLVNFLWSMKDEPGCSAQDIFMSVTTLSFDIAALELYLPLLTGARVELVRRAVAMEGHQLRELFEAVQPTIMQATPATWHLLLDAGWTGSQSLTALCGGEALSADLAEKLRERSKAVWNMYGPTETTIWSTISNIAREKRDITIGRPIANTEIYILDRHMRPVPVGVPGELYIGGHGLARGYHRRPDLTAERFIAHPFSSDPHARLYRTGDLARYRSDGRILHLGRLDHQVKIRGFRIELGEIEAVLSRHPAVRQVVVTARDDQQGLKQLVAYLVSHEGQAPSSTDLRAFVHRTLPDYMMPSFFVFLEALPLTANNKVNVNALPPPAVEAASSEKIYVGPRNGMEVQLAALWQQVLGLSKIGIHDNFFDLGGHSLKAAQLFFLLEQVYGRHLPLATLFQAPTIAALASVLSHEQWVPPWQSLVAIQPSGSAIPMFMVPGVGGNVLVFAQLARLLGADQPVYGLQTRGLDGNAIPFTSVPDMACHYIAEIRTCRPQGPYVILGSCTGGLIAYEMAQQLLAQGESVTLVVMDTWHPSSYRPHRHKWPMRMWLPLFILWRTLRNFDVLLRMPMKDWRPFVRRKYETLFSFVARRSTEDKLFIEFQVERMKQSTFHAVARYVLRNYPGRILNIVASTHHVAETVQDTRYVWDQLAGGGCQTVHVAAAHAGFLLASPHVEELSAHVQAFLAVDAQDTMACDRRTRDVMA
ncbi:MAG: amino acid adenylation domain-containing protein [Nitrospirota bacterium]|nr:amino acid adenylation domain-containing protein [Nitrospirota bacterium]